MDDADDFTRISLRMTRTWHKLLSEEAAKSGRSLNSEIMTRLDATMTFGFEPWTDTGEMQMSNRLHTLAQTCESFVYVIEEMFEAIEEKEEQFPRNKLLRWHGWRNLARAFITKLRDQQLSTSGAKLQPVSHPALATALESLESSTEPLPLSLPQLQPTPPPRTLVKRRPRDPS